MEQKKAYYIYVINMSGKYSTFAMKVLQIQSKLISFDFSIQGPDTSWYGFCELSVTACGGTHSITRRSFSAFFVRFGRFKDQSEPDRGAACQKLPSGGTSTSSHAQTHTCHREKSSEMFAIVALSLLPAVVFAAVGDEYQTFSFPPNNTPVTKVYVFGTPLYVRQPFVLPQRDEPLTDWSNFQANSGQLRLSRQTNGETFPLPQCYTNDSGFMCCNKRLEEVMKEVFASLKNGKKKFHTCNVQSISNNLQKRLEDEFKTEFEIVSGIGDFASKVHFWNDLICKIEIEGRFLQAWATPGRDHPEPETTTSTPVTVPYRQ